MPHQTIAPAATTPATPKRYQCRHIFTDGHRCGSPCLRREAFCYYHHTTRRPVADPGERRARTSTFHLPLPEDRSAIQASIGEILQRIAANEIDPKRAGLLLYGLQIASLNLPKEKEPRHQPALVEEIETSSELGTLAPQTEFLEEKQRPTSLTLLLESLRQTQPDPEEQNPEDQTPEQQTPEPATLPTLHATAEPALHRPHPRQFPIPTILSTAPPQPNFVLSTEGGAFAAAAERPASLPQISPTQPTPEATKSPAFAGLLQIQQQGFMG